MRVRTLVYSPSRKSIPRKGIQGIELCSTPLPDTVDYQIARLKQPVFSSNGRHVVFIGRANTGEGV
jgi:hypothetical protein